MKLLTSKKFKLPKVYFITDRIKIKDIPIGIPFIYGDLKSEEYLVRILEYEVLFQEAVKSGYPFNFKQILVDNGYLDLEDFNYTYGNAPRIDFSSEGYDENVDIETIDTLKSSSEKFKKYVTDSSSYVDLEKLKNLNVFPVWLESIEKAVHTNIHNFAVFNNNMYNKKLEGMYGGIDLISPDKNLIIIDISNSIPKAVSSTCLTLAKSLSETFYADLMITGSHTSLYPYEEVHSLDTTTLYAVHGMGNEQRQFKALLTGEERVYKTAIVFGDDDHPGYQWTSEDSGITDKDGQELCKWKIEKLISFHTRDITDLPGYARWFEPKEVEKIADWVKYL